MDKSLKFEWMGFTGIADWDSKAQVYFGRVDNIKDIVTFQGTDTENCELEFRISVEEYINFKEELSNEPF